MIHKVRSATRLLLSNPARFIRLLRDRIAQRQKLSHLRDALSRSAQKPIYSLCGETLLPFHDDGDMQELLYHVHGKKWFDAELAILSRFVKPGHTFVDVGTNLGFITGIASKLVGSAGQVHSFEPSPVVHAKLLGVIEANKWSNVTPHNVGCGAVVGELKLASPTGSSGNATLTQTTTTMGPVQDVKIVVLDNYLSPVISRLDFLKIDTEGFEDQVLEGARQLIETYKPIIYIELASEYLQSSMKAIKLLRSHGYHFEVEPDMTAAHNGDNFIAYHPSQSGH
jgi:FkbM family methyltransferase